VPARPLHGPARRRHHVRVLAILFGAIWIALAIRPRHREDWALENALVVGVLLVLGLAHRRLALSSLSYTLIFVFLTLHAVGAHYTYSEVPYDAWFAALTGHSLDGLLGWRRNNFDRIVHFLFGLLLVSPIRQVLVRATGIAGPWSYLLPLTLTMASSATYELVEWAAAMVFGGALGIAYVGAQGDPWDAQKDMGLATLGALVGMAVAAAASRWRSTRPARLRRPRTTG
jgi:putative membrane protein